MLLDQLNTLSEKINLPFAIKMPDAKEIKLGERLGQPSFQISINNQRGLSALNTGTELKICEAYMNKDIDLNGSVDMMKLLEITQLFAKEHPLYVRLSKWMNYFRDQVQINRQSIAKHYEFDDDFYLYFLDKTRAYSHGIFMHDQESLEVANTRKLEFAMTSCHVSPGSKVLDIGAGWGCAIEYFGSRNIAIDGITISNHSFQFISNLIKNKRLNQSNISKIDFLNFKAPAHSYDAILSLGTLEHLPDYQRVLTRCSELLREGAYAYFDASATDSTQLVNSYFIDKYIFSGNHKCLDIHAFLNAVKHSDFELISLHNDRHNYYLTLKGWAQNLDRHKDEIIQRWDETLYRKFQLYFWGCCYAMAKNQLQAYRVVLRKKVTAQP